MARSLAYICVEHPSVQQRVALLDDSVQRRETSELFELMFYLHLDYCPIICCAEGSSGDVGLRASKGMRDGHNYSVVKEVVGGI